MTRPSIIASAVLAVLLAFAGLAGTALAQASAPAEAPPASFAGSEFVDSRGCIFVRVEVGDRVDWAPRVGPDRQPVCGLPPTMAAGNAAEDGSQGVGAAGIDDSGFPPVGGPVATRTVQRPAIAKPAAPEAAPAPATGASDMARASAAPSPSAVAIRPVIGRISVPSRPDAARAPRAASAVAGPQVRGTAPPRRVLLPPNLNRDDVRLRVVCPGNPVDGHRSFPRARCRPEPMHSTELVHGTRVPETPADGPVVSLRIERPSVPPGYRIGWNDGRLNPYRGIRTETGEAEMRKIWTDTVPRRLVVAD